MPRISCTEPCRVLSASSLVVKIFPSLANVTQHAVEYAQKLDGNRARQRPAAKGGAVHSGMHAAGDTVGREQRSQRKTGCQRFRDGDDVRLDAVMLVGEILSSPSQAALDFVQNQQRSGAVA